MTMASFTPKHFDWRLERRIATIRLTRAERKNPLTFDSYAELRDTFRALAGAEDVGAVVFASNGGHFCSGGDVHEIIGPLARSRHERAAGIHEAHRRTGESHPRAARNR